MAEDALNTGIGITRGSSGSKVGAPPAVRIFIDTLVAVNSSDRVNHAGSGRPGTTVNYRTGAHEEVYTGLSRKVDSRPGRSQGRDALVDRGGDEMDPAPFA